MKKTLVLVVDRDDDFGVKADVQTPVIGLDGVLNAASMLALVDPEDSDVNTVYAAVKIYNEIMKEGGDAEIALICGDTKVGHRSDMKIADELDTILDIVSPDRAVLVGDGAEDEYVYPMISSRIMVDSVKKVYVKQAPGLEGAFYVLTKILRDNDKRKRLLAPIGILIMVIAAVMAIPVLMNYRDTSDLSILYNATGVFALFAVGMLLWMYAYRAGELTLNFLTGVLKSLRAGDVTVIFTIVAIALFSVGIILGITAAMAPAIDDGQRIIIFLSNSLWVMAFAYICNDFGRFLGRYIEQNKIVLGFMVGTLMIFAAAFIIQASLDALSVLFAYDIIGMEMIWIEYIIGFAFAAAAGMTQISYKRFLSKMERSDAL